MADEEEQRLYAEIVEASYRYFSYIKPRWMEKAAQDTKDLVIDFDHVLSEIYFPNPSKQKMPFLEEYETEISKKDDEEELCNIFRRLSLILHPDKCKDEYANDLFIRVRECFEKKDLQSLKKFENKIRCGYTLQQLTIEKILNDKQRFVEECKKYLWYKWVIGDTIIRDILITREELEKRKGKRIHPSF